MKKYRLVVFDLDGTLADTSLGILNSHRYAHKMMGRQEPTDAELCGVIGGPLLQTYQTRFGFSDDDARRAVDFYRSYYAEKGIHEASLYPGMKDTLRELNRRGILLGVATLKAERFGKTMLEEMGVANLFHIIRGMDETDTRTKAKLIQMCITEAEIALGETIMVGDSVHDFKGAKEIGVDFLAVTYGFGFVKGETPLEYVCHSPMEICSRIL